jgi:hypothetical protein
MNKEETKEYMKIWFKNHPENIKRSQKKYYENNREKRLNNSRQWALNNPNKVREWNDNHPNYIKNWIKNNAEKAYIIFRRYREKNWEKIKAQHIANKVYPIRQICSVVGCNELGERHHPDYDKPLKIIWLCRNHHKEYHKIRANSRMGQLNLDIRV